MIKMLAKDKHDPKSPATNSEICVPGNIPNEVLAELASLRTRAYDEYDERIRDLASEQLEATSTEYAENMRRMRAASSSEQTQIKSRQLELLREEVLIIEKRLDPTKISDEERTLSRLQAAIGQLPPSATPEEALRHLGIIKVEDNTEYYSYPCGVFPRSTDDKWYHYLRAVDEHVAKSKGLAHMTSGYSQSDIEITDRARRVAHNAFSSELERYLGKYIDHDEARDVANKMREHYVKLEDVNKIRLAIGETVVRGMREHWLPDYDDRRDPLLDRNE